MAVPLIIGAAISAGAGLLSSHLNNKSARAANATNLAFAEKQFAAQQQQQQFANEAYIEERDYSRALQQQMFDREDTSLQRSVQDATAAGFSPLAALGNMAGAGPVVSSPSAPGNMVSGNQAHQVATTPGEGISSAAGLFMTALENKTARDHDLLKSDLQLAGELQKQGAEHAHQRIMKVIEEGIQMNADERKFMHDINMMYSSQDFQREMLKVAQDFQREMASDGRQHDKDMAQLDIDTASQQESALARLASNSSPEIIVDLLRRIDSKIANRVADFIEDNPEYSYAVADLIRSLEELPVTINNYAAAASPVEGTTPPVSRSGRASSGGRWNPTGTYYYSPSDLGR